MGEWLRVDTCRSRLLISRPVLVDRDIGGRANILGDDDAGGVRGTRLHHHRRVANFNRVTDDGEVRTAVDLDAVVVSAVVRWPGSGVYHLMSWIQQAEIVTLEYCAPTPSTEPHGLQR